MTLTKILIAYFDLVEFVISTERKTLIKKDMASKKALGDKKECQLGISDLPQHALLSLPDYQRRQSEIRKQERVKRWRQLPIGGKGCDRPRQTERISMIGILVEYCCNSATVICKEEYVSDGPLRIYQEASLVHLAKSTLVYESQHTDFHLRITDQSLAELSLSVHREPSRQIGKGRDPGEHRKLEGQL